MNGMEAGPCDCDAILCIIASLSIQVCLQIPWKELLSEFKNGDELSHGFLKTFSQFENTKCLCVVHNLIQKPDLISLISNATLVR